MCDTAYSSTHNGPAGTPNRGLRHVTGSLLAERSQWQRARATLRDVVEKFAEPLVLQTCTECFNRRFGLQ